jgi:hypothetical protein
MIFKIFSPKNLANNWRFLLKLLLVFAKIVIITLVFEKNANFFAKNWQKSQKIVIITSPGRATNWETLSQTRLVTLVNSLRKEPILRS